MERYNVFDKSIQFPLRVPLEQRITLTMANEIQVSKAEMRRKHHQ